MKLITAISIVLGVVLSLSGCSAPEQQGVLDVGQNMRPMSFSLISDNEAPKVFSMENTADKLIVMNFWASWCGPCRKEMPSLQRLSDKLDPSKYLVLGISVDDDVRLAQEFLLDEQIRFVNVHDADKVNARQHFGIEAYPVTYIINPNGKIVRKVLGEQVWDSQGMVELLADLTNTDTKAKGSFAFDTKG